MNNEQVIASVHVIRDANGKYGVQVVTFDHGFGSRTLPCHFETLTGLFSVASDLTADALKSRKGAP